MKRFIFKIGIFACIIGIPFLVLNTLYKHSNYWKCANELYEVKNYPEDISLCNVGNSHEMFGLRYTKYYNGVSNNFATSSQPFYYSYQVLKDASGSIEDNAVVLIGVSYFDWYYDWRNLFKRLESYNDRYYSFLKPWQIYNFDTETYIERGLFPLLTAKDSVKYVFSDISLPDIEPVLETNASQQIEAVVDYKYNSLINEVMDLGENKEALLASNRRDAQKLISYCYEKNYTPVLICAPITKNLTDRFSEDFMKEFDENNAWLCGQYKDLVFLDYSRDERFCTHLEWFKDSDHLNSIGGDLFTQQVLDDLVAEGILDKDMVVD